MSFIERSFYETNPQSPFVSGPHIELIAEKLDRCRQGKIKRLVITLPPRNLKSHCASIALPAWILGHNPAAHIICASYGQDLADKLARDCRNVMLMPWYQALFTTRLSERVAVNDFSTSELGTRLATSVGGVLTGRGADFIIIDDPIKPDEALSESRRNNANEWFDHSLVSRLNDKAKGCIIIVMQRLHQDDLVGHVLQQEDWEVVSFPAIAEHDENFLIETPFGHRRFDRRAGEALHPEREPLETLLKMRQTMGEYNFASQYQQTPVPRGGAIIKTEWLKFYEPGEQPAKYSSILQSWDTANKTTDLHDYSVCTTWGYKDKRCYLLHVSRKRLNYPNLKREVQDLAQRYKPTTILIEDKASGTQLIQDLKADGVIGIKEYVPPTGTDKIMRLHAQSAMFENGLVYLPKHASWLGDYVTEITGFPGTRFADQVDSTTQALDHLKNYSVVDTWVRAFGPGRRRTHYW